MDRVGGPLHLAALEGDARLYDDVLIAMAGEAQAQRIAEMERKARGGR